MAANKNKTTYITVRGKLYYAKVLGKPVQNYNKDGTEWNFDLLPLDEQATRAALRKVGIADRLREKDEYLDGQSFMSLKQRGERKDGSPNDPIKIEDVTGEDWGQTRRLGNETVADVKLRVVDYGKGMKKGVYVTGIRVLDHVKYDRPVFDKMDDDDPYNPKNRGFNSDDSDEQVDEYDDDSDDQYEDDLDDDVPFETN